MFLLRIVSTEVNGEKRLMRSNEYYSKRISEMWYSVREAVESKQIRDLPKEVMEEGCQRMFSIVKGNKVEVEPKEDMNERMGKSPDLFDAFAIAIEGARQRGFAIKRIGADKIPSKSKSSLQRLAQETQSLLDKRLIAA